MTNKKNIFLTGFMGSGKTTAGQKLAKKLDFKFIDCDHYLEQKEKISIASIFENFGEEAFRKMEQNALHELLKLDKHVIALGGGTVCYEDNLAKIKKNGILIYIELPAITLMQRLERSKTNRPLLKKLKGIELLNFIEGKLKERLPFYNKAHIIVSGIDLTPKYLQQKISDYKAKHN